MTPKQVDFITNMSGGATGMFAIALMTNAIDFKTALIGGFITQVVTSVLTGKGIPTVQTIVSELQEQSVQPSTRQHRD